MKRNGILRTLVWLAISVFVLILAAPAAQVQASQGSADFRIEPPNISVTKDEIFTVNVKVDASSQPIDGAQVYLNFDPNYLRVVNANGNETNQVLNGELYNTTWPDILTNTADNSTSQVNYAAGKGLSGSSANTLFTLATVRFKAIAQTGDTPTSLIFNTNVPRATKAVYGLNTVTGTITSGTVTISGVAGSGATGSAAAPILTAATASTVELAGVTNVTSSVTAEGKFIENVAARSENKKVEITIPKDTIGKDKAGTQLSTINILEMTKPPAPPAGSGVIGLVYDIGPEGATFNPPIELRMTYSESEIPQGVAEGNLAVATWDETASQWLELESTVAEDTNTATAKVSHFTAFTILAHTRPASFTVSNLMITPGEINVDESVTVSVVITNSGDLIGTYGVTIKVGNAALETKNVTLIGSGKETISFIITTATAGEYTIDVNGLVGALRVNEVKKEAEKPESPKATAAFSISAFTISPTEVNIGENVNVTATLTNTGEVTGTYEVALRINNVTVETREIGLAGGASQKVTFTTAKDVPGKYEVNVSGLSGIFSVKAPPALPAAPTVSPVNWRVIGSIIAGVALVIGLILWMMLFRRRTRGV